jgi:hypothetical protein
VSNRSPSFAVIFHGSLRNVFGLELPEPLVAEMTRLLPPVFRELGLVGSRIWESTDSGTQREFGDGSDRELRGIVQ